MSQMPTLTYQFFCNMATVMFLSLYVQLILLNLTGNLQMDSPSWMRLSPAKGGLPVTILNTSTPIAHTSHLLVYFCFLISSGAKYTGVPTMVCIKSTSCNCFVIPKSPTLHTICLFSLVIKMFNPLMSLCTILLPCMYSTADIIWVEYFHICYSPIF